MALIYENRTYLGKTLKNSGVGKKGEWKLYEVLFEAEGQYDFKCKMFGSCKGKELLEEGDEVCIGYEEGSYPHPEHGDIKTRTIKHVTAKQDKSQTTLKDKPIPTQTSTTPSVNVEVKSDVKVNDTMTAGELEFFKEYKDNMISAGHSITDLNFNHFIGTYLMNKEVDVTFVYASKLERFWEESVVPKQ